MEVDGLMSPSEMQYFCPSLRDAKKLLNTSLNLMAKVSEIGAVLRSRGSDHVLTLKLIDPSESSPGLPVNFFAENPGMLPQVKSTGDMISLHHVELWSSSPVRHLKLEWKILEYCIVIIMRANNEEFYCIFNEKLSSFALFDGQDELELSPYQTSTRYEAEDLDKKFLLQLRTLLLDLSPDQGYAELLETFFCHIRSGEKLSIVCKVLHVCETSEGDLMLFVWDATDSPLVTLRMDLNMEGQTPISLHPEVTFLSREALCAFPRIGTILKVIVCKAFEGATRLRSVGCWFKLCNIIFEPQSGLWKGALGPSSSIYKLSNEDDSVKVRESVYNDRVSFYMDRLPISSFPRASDLTDTDSEYSTYSTLMESLAHSEVLHVFRTMVRVVSAYPWQAKDLRSPESGQYRLRLTLEDPTARIHAYIFKEDGEEFFNGYPPIDVLTEKMNRLLGIRVEGSSTGPRNPPWVWCCLKSYFVEENDQWGSRRYRIFGTKLI